MSCRPWPRQDSGKIRGKKSYMELSTQKGGIFFTTPALKALSDSYTELSTSYEKKQSELVKEVIAVVGKRVARRGCDVTVGTPTI